MADKKVVELIVSGGQANAGPPLGPALGPLGVNIVAIVNKINEIERYIVRKPVMEDLNEDDVVEITGGPFKGMRAKITRLDKSKGEVTLELLEATFTLPITVHSDYVKLVEKAKA